MSLVAYEPDDNERGLDAILNALRLELPDEVWTDASASIHAIYRAARDAATPAPRDWEDAVAYPDVPAATPTSEREAWIRRSAQNLIDYPEILDLLAILDATRAERDAALAALPDDPRVDDGYGGKVCYACMSYLDSGDGHNDGCQWAALRAPEQAS